MARIFHAPGITNEEIDVSDILSPTGISNGGIVINSVKGPINRPVLVSNDKEFIDTFGEPYFTSGTSVAGVTGAGMLTFFPEYGYGAYASLEFLKESGNLYVVRQINTGDKYAGVEIRQDQNVAVTNIVASATSAIGIATSGIAASQTTNPDKVDRIQNLDDYNNNVQVYPLLVGSLYPGSDGNNYAVTVEILSNSADWRYAYDNYTSADTTATASYPIASKVFKLNVYDKGTNAWTDYMTLSADTTNNRLRISPVETFYGTLVPQLDANKNQLFIENLVNGNSKYIYVKVRSGSTFGSPVTTYSYLPVKIDENSIEYVDYCRLMQLGNGAVVAPANAGLGNNIDPWALFENRENAAVSILIAPTFNTTVKQEVARIAESRGDCIAVLQTGDPTDETTAQVKDSELYGYVNPSYVALYCGWSKTYDKYNDRFLYLPNAIYGAQIMARTDNVANPWDAPAGTTRATLSVYDQRRIWTYDEKTGGEIGQLYDKNINSVRFIPGQGFVMWGNKTAQMKKSALDRINVRRNLLYIEGNEEASLVPFVFENNTIRTRSRMFALIDPFLAQIKAAGGLYDYKLVVDETNNTTDIIDQNRMRIDTYLQNVRAAEFINLRTIVTRTGISFEEIRIA